MWPFRRSAGRSRGSSAALSAGAAGAYTTIRQLIDITCALDGVLIEPDLSCNNSGATYRYAQKSGAVMSYGLLRDVRPLA
jgi:hypothetical protein